MEKPVGRKENKKEKEAGVQKVTLKEGWGRPIKRPMRAWKSHKEWSLTPEDEAYLFDAFDTSFRDDFEGGGARVCSFQRKKPYERTECGRLFKHKTENIRHQRAPTGEKPFKSDQCGKTFRHSSDVTKHQRIHTGEKPFKCGECGKAFNCGSNLQEHQKMHTGEKPSGCKECGKAFACSSCLIWHRKCHLQEKH